MTGAEHIAELADSLINNHAKFTSFAWFDRPADSARWCIVYTSNRDADYLTRANHKVYSTAMAPFLAHGRDCLDGGASHWAVGHVDGFAIRVRSITGKITRAFAAYAALKLAAEDYPILDDDLCSEEEREEADKTWLECYGPAERIEYLRKRVSPTDNHEGHSYGYGSFAELLRAVRQGDTGAPYGRDGYYPLAGGC